MLSLPVERRRLVSDDGNPDVLSSTLLSNNGEISVNALAVFFGDNE